MTNNYSIKLDEKLNSYVIYDKKNEWKEYIIDTDSEIFNKFKSIDYNELEIFDIVYKLFDKATFNYINKDNTMIFNIQVEIAENIKSYELLANLNESNLNNKLNEYEQFILKLDKDIINKIEDLNLKKNQLEEKTKAYYNLYDKLIKGKR